MEKVSSWLLSALSKMSALYLELLLVPMTAKTIEEGHSPKQKYQNPSNNWKLLQRWQYNNQQYLRRQWKRQLDKNIGCSKVNLVGIVVFCNNRKLNDTSHDKQNFVNILEKSWKVPNFRAKKHTSEHVFSFLCAMYNHCPKEFKIIFEKLPNHFLPGMPHIHGLSNTDCHVTISFFWEISNKPKMLQLATFCWHFANNSN